MYRILATLMLAAVCASLCACMVPRAEYDQVVSQRDELQAKLQENGIEVQWLTPEEAEASASAAAAEEAAKPVDPFDPEQVAAQIQKTPYTYSNSTGNTYTVVVLKNNSEYDVRVRVDAAFTAKNGAVTEKTAYEYAFSAGKEIAVCFKTATDYDSAQYTVTAERESEYVCVLNDLKSTVLRQPDKAVITLNNTGTLPVQYLQYTALFFKDGKLVRHGTGYSTDAGKELMPGTAVTKQAECAVPFDDVQVYFTGRAQFA